VTRAGPIVAAPVDNVIDLATGRRVGRFLARRLGDIPEELLRQLVAARTAPPKPASALQMRRDAKRSYDPAAEGEAAGRRDRSQLAEAERVAGRDRGCENAWRGSSAKKEPMTINREELISKPYRVLLWSGREVEAWASGAQNNFATLGARLDGNWAALGEWPWSTLQRARRENTPLRQ
jgi:hypothetical protein